jgi:hypothetical protein
LLRARRSRSHEHAQGECGPKGLNIHGMSCRRTNAIG